MDILLGGTGKDNELARTLKDKGHGRTGEDNMD